MKKFNFLFLVAILIFVYYEIKWSEKSIVAAYLPESKNKTISDDFKIRNNSTKDLYFGISGKNENVKFSMIKNDKIANMIREVEKNYPQAIEIRIKPICKPSYTVRYIKDKKSNWILTN